MRPVDKGNSPYEKIPEYQDAATYLEKRIGACCSFCEMRVSNALAVEHKESKNSGGALTDWDNLLLSCVYCNSRKLEKIRKGNLDKWIWPDQHNNFLAYTYENALPKVNESYLKTVSEDVLKRVRKVMEDLALDYIICQGGQVKENFAGTSKECFDKNGTAVRRNNNIL